MPYPIPYGREFEVNYMEAPSSYMMPSMCASDYYEMSILISGERKCVTHDHVYFAHTGNIVTGAPYIMHQTSSTSDVPYTRILVKFTFNVADSIKQKLGSNIFDTIFSRHTHHISEDGYKKICAKFYEMLEEYDQYDKYSDTILKDMLFHLLTMLIKYETFPKSQDSITLNFESESIFKALTYIDCNFCDSPSIEEVAKHVGLSTSYFSRLFKKVTNTNYSEYLILSKLQSCRNQLVLTDNTIQEIADSINMCNANYLSNLFKKYYGSSPREYRKMHKK